MPHRRLMTDVLDFPTPARVLIKDLTDSAEIDAPRAADYLLSAERGLWRMLAASTDNPKLYELALMVASSNLEDSMKHMAAIKAKVDGILDKIK